MATTFDAAALGLGAHTLTHIHTAQLDTVLFADQLCCITGITVNTFLQDDEVSWQPFAPQHTGALESIRIPLELFNTPRQIVVELLQGQGLGGAVLHTDTITGSAHNGVLLTGTGLTMAPGETYTWTIRKVPDGNAALPPMIHFTLGEEYPLAGYAPNWSDTVGTLRFEEYIVQQFTCTDSTALSVEVEVCSGIGDVLDTFAGVGPNPFDATMVINHEGDAASYALYASTGQRVADGRLQGRSTTVRLEGLSGGAYHLVLRDADGMPLRSMRLVKVE